MKKIKLLLAAVAAMVTMGVQAQSWTASEVGAGYYMLYNVGTGQYLTRGNGWGTQASITTAATAGNGIAVQLEAVGDDFKIRTNINADGYGLEHLSGGTIYTDQSQGKNSTWTFTQVSTDNGPVYTIVSKDNHGGGAGAYLTAGANGTIVTPGADGTIAGAKWKLMAIPAQPIGMNDATEENPVDATSLIADANFSFPAIKQDVWTMVSGNYNPCGGDVTNPCAESWCAAFTLSQEITVPNGIYELTAQAALTDYSGAYDGTDYPVVYANNVTAPFKAMSETDRSSNMSQLSGSFSSGNYVVGPIRVVVTNKTLTIGVRGTRTDTWCIWDNFKLTYKGVDLSELKAVLQAQIDAVPDLEGTTTTAAYNAAKNYADGIDVDALTTEEAISTASTELANLVNAAKALQANYTRYNNIKNAAKTIASATNTTDTDATVEAATTTAAIDAAVVALRTAFLAELPNVTVPETGLDVTAVMVDNASVSQNTDYWTIANLSSTGGSAGVCNYGECEFYNRNFKFYQTLALSKGTWEFGVTGFHREGNHNTNFYAGGSKVLIPGVPGSGAEGQGGIEWVNNMAQAKTYFDAGKGKVSVKFALDADGNVEIGIDNQDTETDKWTIFRDFTLKYYGEAVDLTPYKNALAEAVSAANAMQSSLPTAAYSALQTVVTNNNQEYTSVAEYETATSNIETATNNVKAIADAYTAYKSLSTAVQALYNVANYEELIAGARSTLGTAISDAATEVETKTTVDDINAVAETLRAAGVTYAGAANPTNGAKFNLTFMLTNPNLEGLPTWTGAAGWHTDQTDGNSQVMTNGNATSADGTKTAFYEYYSNPAKTNNLFALYQKVTLAEGTYNMTCYAFAQNDGTHVNHPNGVYFYANDVQGSAVNNARLSLQSIEFVNAEEQEVKIGLKTVTGNANFWMGIGYVELYKIPAKVVTIDEAVDYVAESAAAKVILNRTIKANTWNTIVLPFQLTNSELKAAFGDDVQIAEFSDGGESANAVTINFNTMATPAITPNKPVLLKTSTAGTSYTFEGRTIAAGDAKVAGTYVDFVGTYAASTTIAEGNYFISANNLYKSNGGTTVKGTRAYIDAKNVASGEVKLFIGGIETAISEINGEAAENGAIYNLAGQRVSKAQKGVFIVNGKKVIVK